MQPDMGRRGGPAGFATAGVERGHVEPETVLGPQRGAPGPRHVGIGEHRQHAVANQLEHVAAGVMDGIDGGLGVIVEKRNDLVGSDGFADRGRAAQVGKPQHGADALGDAARDAAAQHLLGRVTPEIDPAERARDLDLGCGFDRQSQHRHQVAQRRQALLSKAGGPPGRPVGIDTVHLPDGSGLAEPVYEADEVPVPARGEIGDHREVERWIGKIEPQFVMAAFEHVIKRGAAPVQRGVALAGRPVFEAVALVGFGVVPAESAALENRVQRIDEDDAARQLEALRAAALAEAANQIVLRQSGQPLAHHPVHQLQPRRQVHATLCRVTGGGERRCRAVRRARLDACCAGDANAGRAGKTGCGWRGFNRQ